MARDFIKVLFVLFASLGSSVMTVAAEEALPTDINIVTAIDVSGSVGLSTGAFQFDSVAAAVVHPEFLEAVSRGYHRRIGFTAFTWSTEGGFSAVIPWTAIESEDGAVAIAKRLQRVERLLGRARLDFSMLIRNPTWRHGPSTDVSMAIHAAIDLLLTAPFPSSRQVINICANGVDNVGEGPAVARARALEADAVVNALIMGEHPEVAAYFRQQVQGGPGSFVVETRHFDDVADAMLAKFLMDLALDQPTRWIDARMDRQNRQ